MQKTLFILLAILFLFSGCGDESATMTDSESGNVYKQDGTQYLKPVADAGADQNVKVGTSVRLDGSGSTDSNGTIVSYEWKEGLTLLSKNKSFTKSNFSLGTHTITLTVTDNDGVTASDTLIITVNAIAPHKAELSVLYNPDTNIALIRWDESKYRDSIGYRVEKSEITLSSSSDNWSEVRTFNAGNGSYSVQDHTSVAVKYRVVALSDEVLLSGDNGTTEVVVNPLITSKIYFSSADGNLSLPLNRIVTVNTQVEAPSDIQKVTYYLDTKKIGESSKKPNFPFTFNSASQTNGNHRLDNELKIDNSSYITFYTPISTYNTNLNMSLRLGKTTGVIPIIVSASSKESLNGVQIYLDDQLVADIKEKNYCSSRYGCYDNNDSYMWEWNSTKYSPNTYTIRADVSDGGGESLSKTITQVLNNPPVIKIASPINESVVGNTLYISGSVSDDQNDTTVSIKVGSQTIYSSNTSSFSTSYIMSGLAQKVYTIEIKATDVGNKSTTIRRSVLYKVDSNLQIWKTLGSDGSIVQLNNGYLLYKNSVTKNLTRLNLSNKISNTYNLGTIHYDRYYDITTNGLSSFYGTQNTYDSSIFLADTAVAKIGTGQHPILNDNYLLWISSYYSKMYLYSLSDKNTTEIAKPSDSKYFLNNSYYLNSNSFCTAANISSSPSDYDVYLYNLSTKQSTRLTNIADSVEMCQGIDENRVLISESNSTSKALYYANLKNPTSLLKLSDNLSGSAKIADGIIAWVDGENKNLYVLLNNETVPNIVANNAQLKEVKNGVLTYTKDAKLYLYKDGVSTEIWPYGDSHYIDGNTIYIIRGSDKLVYRIKI